MLATASEKANKDKYAWVTLVMIGDTYVPGALVLAQSLLELNTRHDTVCMVTPDVSDLARKALALLYTKVVQVPFIACNKLPPFQTRKQQRLYGRWIHNSFTRLNCLDPRVFGCYKKIVMLDCDMVFIRQMDHLFKMDAPALTFSTPWAKPYCRNGGIRNHFLDPVTGQELAHQASVPHDLIERGRNDGFVGKASMMLLEPSTETFEAVFDVLEAGIRKTQCVSGFDEQVFADVILKLRTPVLNIHQQYCFAVGKDAWLIPPGNAESDRTQSWRNSSSRTDINPSVYQWYGLKKPWEMQEDSWPDLNVWYNVARNVVHFNPELKDWLPLVSDV